VSNTPSIWDPAPSATIVSDAAYLTGVEIPIAEAGHLAFVRTLGDYYYLNLTSGAPIDNVTVIGTWLGGLSRWLKTGITAGGGGVLLVTATLPITSSGGVAPNIAIVPATDIAAGSMSAADKTKLDGLPASAVPTSRTLTAGAGLTGGGDLSANRTFDVGANPDGSIAVNADDIQVGVLATDAQHGLRGGGTQHTLAIANGAAGFLSGADKAKIDGYPAVVPDAVLVFGAAGVGTTTTARYLSPGSSPNNAQIVETAIASPRAGTVKNLRIRHNQVGVGGPITYTLRINGVDSTLTVYPLASSLGGADTAHSPAVAAGDLLEIYVVKGVAIAQSPGNITATLEFD
jgi:hypothetical protein